MMVIFHVSVHNSQYNTTDFALKVVFLRKYKTKIFQFYRDAVNV